MRTLTKTEALMKIESSRDDWFRDDSYTVHPIDSVSIDDSGVYVDRMSLNEKAVSKMLYRMQLTNKFIDYKKEVGEGNFKQVFDNIIKWNQGKQIVARSRGGFVSDVFFYRGDTEFNPESRLRMIFNGVHEKISSMSDDVEIHKLDVDSDRKNIRFSTVDPTTKFSAIARDEWVLGSILSIGLTEAYAAPYYGRLICMNGMVDGIKMRKTSIAGKGYTESMIHQMISKGTNLKKLAGDHIKTISHDASSCDVSLSEYLSMRKIMLEGLDDSQKHMSDHLFPLDHIEAAYGGKQIYDNTDQWKRTAKTGTTVYELLNDITKWTTHDDAVQNQAMKDRLNEKASTWFMKGEWHNRNVAPAVPLRRKPVFSDSTIVF